MRQKYTKLHDDRLIVIDMYNKGMGTRQIAKLYGCNCGTVYHMLKQNNVNIRKRLGTNEFLDFKDQIIADYNSGESCYIIAKKYQLSIQVVVKHLKKLGYDTSRYSTQRVDKIVNYTKEIIDLYLSGMNMSEISKKFNCASSTIFNILTKNNIEHRDNTKYNIDIDFFKKIDSNEKAYTLGIIYTDGNINSDKMWRIQMCDRDVLENIKRFINSDIPIADVKLGKNSTKPQFLLTVGRKEMVDDLNKLGLHPNKSKNLEWPSYDMVPKEYMKAFIAGCVDGDGTIGKGFYFFGTENMCLGMAKEIGDQLSINIEELRVLIHKSIFTLRVTKKHLYMKIFDWLYKDNNYSMARKRLRYEAVKAGKSPNFIGELCGILN